MSDVFWNDRYAAAAASGEPVWSIEPNAWIERVTGTLPPGSAIDLAAGEGRNALWLASRGWRVTAVDFASEGLAIGRQRAASAGLELDWVTADATTWVSPTPADLVVVAYLQLPAAELTAAISNAIASLAPGGTLALIGHDSENLEHGTGGPKDPAMLWGLEAVRSAAAGLDIIECRRYDRTTADGSVAIDTILLATKPA
ncbi:class I SAM-dependent methyltransferase [Frigoribacterium sp. UYMn621]|uniref:class I SAM-dependent methyltransferase n=1 Tax=Frigoribacterium sp. UYMn621 TaxID=3156343 RepID=UPI0033929954